VIPLISKRYSYFHLELITFFNFESTSNKLHIAVLTRTVLNIYEAIGKQSIYSFLYMFVESQIIVQYSYTNIKYLK